MRKFKQALNKEIKVLSSDYLDPINPRKLIGNKLEITANTYAIHHGSGSWLPLSKKIQRVISILSRNILGDSFVDKLKGKETIYEE